MNDRPRRGSEHAARGEADWRVGAYLVERLREAGIGHVFGVPGDYALGFLDRIVDTVVEVKDRHLVQYRGTFEEWWE